jgi:hypothetical protein
VEQEQGKQKLQAEPPAARLSADTGLQAQQYQQQQLAAQHSNVLQQQPAHQHGAGSTEQQGVLAQLGASWGMGYAAVPASSSSATCKAWQQLLQLICCQTSSGFEFTIPKTFSC